MGIPLFGQRNGRFVPWREHQDYSLTKNLNPGWAGRIDLIAADPYAYPRQPLKFVVPCLQWEWTGSGTHSTIGNISRIF